MTAIDYRSVIGAAALAPSSHNTQPWIFQPRDGAIRLLADRTRALPVNDPDDRELTISCGCALLNLRVAIAAEGRQASVRILPEPADMDLLAVVDITAAATAAAGDAALAAEIPRRRTYRKRFLAEEIEEALLDELNQAAEREGAWLKVLSREDLRQQVTKLASQGDELQWRNPSWRRELAAWMHPRRDGDGLTVPGLAAPAAQMVVRSFDMGHGIGARDRELADASPVLAVLGTRGDETADWLRAGQALERVLLTACAHGLQASYLNQAIQVAALRPRLEALIEAPGAAQALLRLGEPQDEAPPSPRRPLEQVIEEAD